MILERSLQGMDIVNIILKRQSKRCDMREKDKNTIQVMMTLELLFLRFGASLIRLPKY